VQGEDQISVTQETLRRYLGADYEIRSFGGIMSAFNGLVITTSDAITCQSVAQHKAEQKAAAEQTAAEMTAEEKAVTA
jgi:toluene monooxygenase system protein D